MVQHEHGPAMGAQPLASRISVSPHPSSRRRVELFTVVLDGDLGVGVGEVEPVRRDAVLLGHPVLEDSAAADRGRCIYDPHPRLRLGTLRHGVRDRSQLPLAWHYASAPTVTRRSEKLVPGPPRREARAGANQRIPGRHGLPPRLACMPRRAAAVRSGRRDAVLHRPLSSPPGSRSLVPPCTLPAGSSDRDLGARRHSRGGGTSSSPIVEKTSHPEEPGCRSVTQARSVSKTTSWAACARTSCESPLLLRWT